MDLIAALAQAADRLLPSDFDSHLPLEWRWATTPPADPVHAPIDPAWPRWQASWWPRLRARGGNWFYAELEWPERLHGVALAGSQAILFVWGYAAFRLWVDGALGWEEERPWESTGGIADPLPQPIVPGRRVRLVLELRPTELFVGLPLHACVHARALEDIGIQLAAASAQLRYAAALGVDAGVQAQAAACIPAAALADQRWEEVLAGIARLHAVLAPLRPLAQALPVAAVGHSHIDLDWLWSEEDTVACVRRDFRAAAALLADRPDVRFTASQVPSYAIVQEHDPALFARIQALVADGRWEVAAGTWVEGDLAMADGETILRQMRLAGAWCRRAFGRQASVFWAPDTFSHPPNLPQLARLGGMDHYFHWRCAPPEMGPARHWEGLDGSRVLALSQSYTSTLHPGVVVDRAIEARRHRLPEGLLVWGIGDHGGGLPRRWLALWQAAQAAPLLPPLRFATIASVAQPLRDVPLPTQRGETHALFAGCFTSHVRTKRLHRLAEQALLVTETLHALAGKAPPAALAALWQQVAHDQFHDILCGCNAPGSARAADARLAAVGVAATALQDALLPAAAPAPSAVATLLNPVAHAQGGPVWLPRALVGDAIAVASARAPAVALPAQRWGEGLLVLVPPVPALGMLTLRPCPTAAAGPAMRVVAEPERILIEAAAGTVVVDTASGAIVRWQVGGRDRLAHGSERATEGTPALRLDLAIGVLWLIEESGPADAWRLRAPRCERPLLTGAVTTVEEVGPLAVRIVREHVLGASRIRVRQTIWNHEPRIDLHLDIDWRERGDEQHTPTLKLSVGSGLSRARIRRATPFAVVEAPADGQERATQLWCDLVGEEDGIAVCNRGQYGFDALGPRLRLTLVRGFLGPDPDGDVGHHQAELALIAHAADSSVAALAIQALAFHRPLRLHGGPAPDWPTPVQVEAQEVVVSGVERTEDGAWDLHASACGGVAGRLRLSHPHGLASAALVDAHGVESERLSLVRGTVDLAIPAWGIRLVRVVVAPAPPR